MHQVQDCLIILYRPCKDLNAQGGTCPQCVDSILVDLIIACHASCFKLSQVWPPIRHQGAGGDVSAPQKARRRYGGVAAAPGERRG